MPIQVSKFIIPLVGCLLALASQAAAQSRDHLTAKEVELVKEAQEIDKRVEVFIKAVERRMLVLNSAQAANAKQLQKDSDKWGELPQGTRAELIADIAGILDEAITNIDDVSMHDEKSPLLPKALRKLAAAATQLTDQLTPLRTQSKSEAEASGIEQTLENAQTIIDAAKKLPAATTAEKTKSKKTKGGP
jgi:hypothetical protein